MWYHVNEKVSENVICINLHLAKSTDMMMKITSASALFSVCCSSQHWGKDRLEVSTVLMWQQSTRTEDAEGSSCTHTNTHKASGIKPITKAWFCVICDCVEETENPLADVPWLRPSTHIHSFPCFETWLLVDGLLCGYKYCLYLELQFALCIDLLQMIPCRTRQTHRKSDNTDSPTEERSQLQ